MMVVQIQVSDEVWQELMKRKLRPSHTFSQIIEELINESIKKTKQKGP